MEIIKAVVKKYKPLVILTILALFANNSQLFSQCNNKYLYFPEKADTLIIPCKDMVLLNKELFLDYHLSKMALDSIADKIPGLENKLDAVYTANKEQAETLKGLSETKGLQIREKEKTIQQMKNLVDASMQNNEECISRLQRSIKYKKQRDILFGSTLVFGTASIILGFVVF